jgi:hypothetical protein
MVQVADKLKSGPTMGKGSFECWRIKNTHHPSATVIGGYRDVKVFGKFSATIEGEAEPLSMLVEIQIVDQVFLNVKKFMHKPFTVERGDFY